MRIAFAVVLSLLATTTQAQQDPTFLQSYAKANPIIDAAVAAHGGVDALRAARHVRVTLAGQEYHRFQSRRIAPPYDSTRYTTDLMIDLPRGQVVVAAQTRGYPGGFYYTTRFITAGTRHFSVDLRNQTYATAQFPAAEQQTGNLFRLPQFLVLAAHEAQARGQRRALGQRRAGGQYRQHGYREKSDQEFRVCTHTLILWDLES